MLIAEFSLKIRVHRSFSDIRMERTQKIGAKEGIDDFYVAGGICAKTRRVKLELAVSVKKKDLAGTLKILEAEGWSRMVKD